MKVKAKADKLLSCLKCLVMRDLIKDKIRDAVRFFNADFGPLTDAEKAGIKSLECLMIGRAGD